MAKGMWLAAALVIHTGVASASIFNKPLEPLTIEASQLPTLKAAAMCFKQGEQRSGQNKICYYRCLSGTVAITIPALELCPISIEE
jgi:hypothetical protein